MHDVHLPVLIRDLALIMMSAGIVSILFRAFHQPVVLGYLFAGILVGPQVSYFPQVLQADNIRLWGEIGVIFVLFSLGLEFSFRKLMRVGGAALFAALIETSLLLGLGTLVGISLNWGWVNSVFLGGMICISSTTIIAKVFDENRLKGRRFAQLVMGILVVEDIVAVLLMVLLSTIAVTQTLAGGELAYAAARLTFFIVLWFVVGLFILPLVMGWAKSHLNDETILIVSSGLCLLMVVVASMSGFSPALGAFVMGSLLAETSESARIEHVLNPLKNFFAAVFFVSVGMLLDFSIVVENWKLILFLSMVVIVGKSVAVSFASLVAGQPLKTSVRAGMSMTQIGEFSFIIAGLGMSLKVVDDKLYAMAVAISVVTAFTTPFMVKFADPTYLWINSKLPTGAHSALEGYSQIVQTQGGTRSFNLLLRAHFASSLINVVLLIAMTSLCRGWVLARMQDLLTNLGAARFLTLAVNLLVALPFLWGLAFRRQNSPELLRALAVSARLRWIQAAFVSFRVLAALGLFLLILGQYTSWKLISGLSLVMLSVLTFVFYRFGSVLYHWFESQLRSRIVSEESEPKKEAPLLPWDTSLVTVQVSSASSVAGRSLADFGASETFRVMVAAIDRGARRIIAPRGTEIIFPYDKLSLVGSDADIETVRRILEEKDAPQADSPLQLRPLVVHKGLPFCGKVLRESNLRALVDGLVVAIERDGKRWVNPSADWSLNEGDRLWVVGDPKSIQALVES